MINEHNAARILNDIFLAAKMKIDPNDLRYPHYASSWYSKKIGFVTYGNNNLTLFITHEYLQCIFPTADSKQHERYPQTGG